jgi:hypothetical protein
MELSCIFFFSRLGLTRSEIKSGNEPDTTMGSVTDVLTRDHVRDSRLQAGSANPGRSHSKEFAAWNVEK